MKKRLFIIGSVVLSLVLALTIAYASFEDARRNGGIRQIKIVDSIFQGRMLVIGYDWLYSESLKCSIRAMDEDELVWHGWEQIDDEGTLGTYRYEISIIDVDFTSTLCKPYLGFETHVLKDVPRDLKSKVNIRFTNVDDSLSIIYLGSDEPLNIDEGGVDISFPSTKCKIKMKS